MLESLGHVAIAVVRFVFTTLLPIAFLIRVAYKGWLGGFVVKAPAKLIISGIGAGLAAIVGARAVAGIPDLCGRSQYGLAVFMPAFLFTFVLLMSFSRAWNLEWRWARLWRRNRWPGALRGIDGIAGILVEVLAGLFIVGFVLASFRAAPAWLNALYPVTKSVSGALPDWLNGTALWNDSVDKITTATGTSNIPHRDDLPLLCATEPGPEDLENTVLLGYLGMALLGPLAAILSFEAFTYAGQSITRGSGCPVCAGSGRNPNLLLVGSLCEECGGYGIDPETGFIGAGPLDMSVIRIVGYSFLLGCSGCCCFMLAWTIPR
jgi:hypothetical protein